MFVRRLYQSKHYHLTSSVAIRYIVAGKPLIYEYSVMKFEDYRIIAAEIMKIKMTLDRISTIIWGHKMNW